MVDPLSRQLTTSTAGWRTASTPASFEPETTASEVPPSDTGGVGERVPTCVGIIVAQRFTDLERAEPFTQAAWAVRGKNRLEHPEKEAHHYRAEAQNTCATHHRFLLHPGHGIMVH